MWEKPTLVRKKLTLGGTGPGWEVHFSGLRGTGRQNLTLRGTVGDGKIVRVNFERYNQGVRVNPGRYGAKNPAYLPGPGTVPLWARGAIKKGEKMGNPRAEATLRRYRGVPLRYER